MEPKLVKFYMKCLMPEIVDSRYARGMSIRTLTLQDDKENVNYVDSRSSPSPEPPMGNVHSLESIVLTSPEPQIHLQPGTSTREINFAEF